MIELNRATSLAFGSLVFTLVLSFLQLVDERWAARLRLVRLLASAVVFAGGLWVLHTRGITVTTVDGEPVTVKLPATLAVIAMLPLLGRIAWTVRAATVPDPYARSRPVEQKPQPVIQSHVALGQWLENPDEAARYRATTRSEPTDGV